MARRVRFVLGRLASQSLQLLEHTCCLLTLAVLAACTSGDSGPGIATASLTEKPVSEFELAGCVGYALLERQLITVNFRSLSSAPVGTTPLSRNLKGLAADPKTRKMYAVDSNTLYQVDPDSAQLFSIGKVLDGALEGLEFGPDGQLYSWSSPGELVRIDLTTGTGTKLFRARLPSLGIDAFAWSPDGSRIYVAKTDRLYSLDPTTGQVTELPGRLPISVGAMHARDDGRILLLPKTASQGGYEVLVLDPSVQPWKVITTYGVIPSDELACGRLKGFTWLRSCGNPVAGGQAPLIKNIALSASEVCSGDTVTIDVTAVHPERPSEAAHVSINSLPGSSHRIQFTGAGTQEILISAQTPDGYVDQKTAIVTVEACSRPLAPPVLRITGNTLLQDGADLTIVNRAAYSSAATFAWNFGDGSSKTGDVPYVAHSYSLSASVDKRFQVFNVSVTVTDHGMSATTQKTLSVWNSYVLDRDDHHTLRPMVFASRDLAEDGGLLSVEYGIANLEAYPLELTKKYIEQIPCDPNTPAAVLPVQAMSLVIPASGFATGTEAFAAASIPSGICTIGLHLRGIHEDKLVQVDQYLRIPARRTWRTVTGSAASSLLLRIRANGWAEDEEKITGADLRRLVLEGRLTRAEVDAALADLGALPQTANERCYPGDIHPTDPNLTCQRTDTSEVSSDPHSGGPWAEVTNASKGDLLLVSACGLVGAALRNVQPEQHYTHEGIMTRNRIEVTHVTLAEERLAESDYLQGGSSGTEGPNRDVLKFGEPGAQVMTAEQAFRGKIFTDVDGHRYVIDHFSGEPLRCPGDTAVIRPRVVKPPIDASPDVRQKLMIAADKALELRDENPHYRLYGFSEGNIPWRDEFRKPGGRPAAVSSVFLWWAIKRAEWDEGIDIPLEGCSLDRSGGQPQWRCTRGDIEDGEYADNGADVDGQTWDGLYKYEPDERRQGLQAIRSYIKHSVYAEGGWLAALAGAVDNFSNKVVNCFAFDVCSETTACTSCASPACCSAEETALNTDSDPRNNVACVFNCSWEDNLLMRGATEGRTVSPDDFLKWDQPAGTLHASPGENGVYGSSEYLDYDDVTTRWVYAWKPSEGFGQVSGHVFLEEGSCSDDTDCDAGTCVDGSCQTPAVGVRVIFAALGAEQQRTTDEQGFYEYLTAPSGSHVLTVDHQIEDQDGIRAYGGSIHIVVPNQGALVDQDIVLRRKTDPSQRLVTLTGQTELLDCDCTGSDEKRTYTLRGDCRVDPTHRTYDFRMEQTELCADEVGLTFWGHCELADDDRTVRVTLNATFYEGVEGSCGGNEREASFRNRLVVVPPNTMVPVAIERLLHKDWCYYGLWAQKCDNKAFFRNLVITNTIAEL